MKKVNIQNDLRSRQEIADINHFLIKSLTSVEDYLNEATVITEEEDAQSKDIQEPTPDQSTPAETKSKKRGRKTQGDI